MPTHAIQLCPCIQKLCNVYYLPTPSTRWIGQIKGRSLSLASARSASWLAYSLYPRSLTRFGVGCRDVQNRMCYARHDGKCGGSFQLPPQENTKFSSGILTTGNAKLTAAMISFYFEISDLV